MKQNEKGKRTDKYFAALSYLWILFLIPLLSKRKSKLVSFHARQGLIFFILSTVDGFIYWVPLLGWTLTIFVLVLLITGLSNSISGKKEPLPFIGKYAGKIKI